MFAQTLVRIDKKVRGWGDAYRFVSNRVAFSQLDAVIDRACSTTTGDGSRRVSKGADPRTRRRTLGVALLADTPPYPLESII